MKILVTGKNGQLGYELQQTQPNNIDVTFYCSAELDITNAEQVNSAIHREMPDIVINAAAYTAVDKAESEQETAYKVNELGCENLATACKAYNAKLIHISTDFVFDGCSSKPYTPIDEAKPIGVYGTSKLKGELAIKRILPKDNIIIRTAWVYSVHGSNFVKSMLKLMAEKEQLGVVYDQIGTPTWAKGLATIIWQFCENINNINGEIFHWTDAGVASWYDFAVAIQNSALQLDLLKKAIPIKPIPTVAYPTPAKRPCYSVLDKSSLEQKLNIQSIHWQKQLKTMLKEL